MRALTCNRELFVVDVELDGIPGNRVVDDIMGNVVAAGKQAVVNDVQQRRLASVAAATEHIDPATLEIYAACLAVMRPETDGVDAKFHNCILRFR
ncbi:hypothetical protein D3C86_1817820 [compost metagenome]